MDNFDNVLVVDADGHVYEGNVDLATRMPEKWRSQAPVRLNDNEGNSRILLEGRLWSASQGLGPGVSGPMTDKARGYRDGMVDPAPGSRTWTKKASTLRFSSARRSRSPSMA